MRRDELERPSDDVLPAWTRQLRILELYQVELEMQNRELRESRRQLEAAQARYADLYHRAPVAYVTLDLAALIVEANAMACTLFGHPRGLLEGSPLIAAARIQDLTSLQAHLRRCLASHEQETCEIPWLSPAGDTGVLQLSSRLETSSDGKPAGYRMTVVDTTAINQAKAEALQLLSERRARAEADEANHQKDEFLAIASHELRTPLNSILGWLQLVQSAPGDRALVDRAVKVALRNTRTLARIVDDLLDVSRIIAGKLQMESVDTDFAEVVRSALDAARPVALAKGLQLSNAMAEDCVVRGDAVRLQQVVTNLLSNAMKFTREGGRVQVALERTESTLRLTVSDDGCGIEAQDLPHVFGRFRQADRTTRRAYLGLGLGLTIARHIVMGHGGEITVRSGGAGAGTAVTVELPAAAPGVVPAPRSSTQVMVEGPFPLAGVRVLVVDDDLSAGELAERFLGRHGAVVFNAASVDVALGLVRGFPPDVIVSDIAMPGRDGYDFIREVRKLPAPLGAVPAIALSAYARGEDAERALEAGFTRHLAKPANPEELVAAIRDALDRT
ncbi:MAG: ATP-binding protein [Polyangiaceae bacterium]